jgi:hypothetical protein
MTVINPRNNWYDFQHVTVENLQREQRHHSTATALLAESLAGSGILLAFPTEPVIFDTDNMSISQNGYAVGLTFDGRGILEEPYAASDLDEGNQVAIDVSGARLSRTTELIATIIGKTFDNTLVYEHLSFDADGTRVSRTHFKEVTNILFQNAFGNLDGYAQPACLNTIGETASCARGRIVVRESSSYEASRDLISAEWVREPDLIFRDYKVYNPGKLLDVVLAEAIGAANNIDELDINSTAAQQRKFQASGSNEVIYAQKFKLVGNEIQKVRLALGLESGNDWSGSLVIGIVPLLTDEDNINGFLPSNAIEFDPDTVPIEEISVNKTELEERGFILDSESTKPVDFVFSTAQISNPSLSRLKNGGWYAITIRRTGSNTVGTIVLDEARNPDSKVRRLSVYSSSRWTDIPSSTLWFQVYCDSAKVASGVCYDRGTRLPVAKTIVERGVKKQHFVRNVQMADPSEGVENYLIAARDLRFSEPETHPRSGDKIASVQEDVPKFTFVKEDELETILISEPNTIVLAKFIDTNAKANPAISGTLTYPGLAMGNTIDIINPGSDLLVQNVVGSIITPNTAKPFKYRIISKEIVSDLLGDINGDGEIDISDLNRAAELDGYSLYLSTTSHSTSTQKNALLNGSVSILELLRADTDNDDGYQIDSDDYLALSDFIQNGTAFPNGGGNITRVRLTVEPIANPATVLDANAESTLEIHTIDPDLVDEDSFSETDGIEFSIAYVPVWRGSNVEVTDLRRFVTTTFTNFSIDDLQASTESGGKNNLLISGDTFLHGNVLNLDGSHHKLDIEKAIIELELPRGDSEGEINIFQEYVLGKMKFSDGTLVSNSALSNNQIKFEVSVSSHVKNVADDDGYNLDFDGYNDGYIIADGYGSNADEAVGLYLDHSTGLLRVRAYNIVSSELYPEMRTRVTVTVNLKRAGFANSNVYVSPEAFVSKLRSFN